jgi:2-iminobutanoate/2-iminopropanoate deaminase
MSQIIHTEKAPKAIGPYSQAILTNIGDSQILYTSGQIALDPETGNLTQESLEIEVLQVLKNLKAILYEADFTLSDVVKSEIFVVNLDQNFARINTVYEEFFGDHKPARATIGVASLPKNAQVEIAFTAIKN